MAVTLVGVTSGSSGAIANGGTLTLTKPSGVAQNDLLIGICGMNGAATSWALPSGWTQQAAFRGNGEELTVWYKVAGASEPASYGFVLTSAGALDGGFGMIALRGADTTTPILANSAEFDQGGASTSMTANSVSWTGAADAVSLIFMTWQSSAATVTWPTGWDNTTNGWTSNDGFEWSVVGCNLTTQSAVTSLPAKTNPPTLSVAEFGQCGQLAIKVAATAAANPFKNSAVVAVQAGRGGRAARRRVGFWHAAADQVSGRVLDIPLAQGIPIAIVFRDRRLSLRLIGAGDLPTLGASSPRLNPAWSSIQVNRGGRPLRRRANQRRYTVSSQRTSIGHGSDTPQRTISPSPTMGPQRGRAQRRRAGQWHRASTETNTVYQDVAISAVEDRSWRTRVSRFKVWEQSAAYLGAWFNQPLRKLAEWMVQSGRGGRPARRRGGFWHTIVDSASTLLQSEIPQLGQYSVWVQSGKVRSRRRLGVQHRSAEGSYTVYQDQVISSAKERSSRSSVLRFRNWDRPAGPFIAAFSTLFPLTKKLAEWWVQAGRGGRAARRRVGFWHTIADQVNPSLLASAETQQRGLADPFVASGRTRSRRRAGQQHAASQETKTVFRDQVISQASERFWPVRVARSRVSEASANFLANFGILVQPFRQLASWIVQATRGGRPTRRRVGSWHQVADQTNTSLLAQSELPQVGLADSFIASGKVRSRRRAGQQHQASQETKTVFRDQVISQAQERSWRRLLGRFLNNEQSGARFSGWLNQPFRQLATWWVQVGRGGRSARRRVGSWHQVSDQVNTSLLSSAELPANMVADVWSMTGRVRGRRRVGPTHQASQETKTVYQERVISRVAAEARATRQVPRLRYWWQTAANWLLNILTGLPPGTLLRFYVQDQEPAASLSSNRQQGALLDAEPRTGLTSAEPTTTLTDNEPPGGVTTRVKGQ